MYFRDRTDAWLLHFTSLLHLAETALAHVAVSTPWWALMAVRVAAVAVMVVTIPLVCPTGDWRRLLAQADSSSVPRGAV